MNRIIMLMALLLVKATLLMAVTSEEAVRKFVNTCGIRPESVAVMIVNLADGDTLGQHNTSMPLLPASIMKAVTTATLLEKASADYRYHTPIYIDGPLDMGILRGNLIVEGACDPSVNSAVEPFGQDIIEEITDALRLAGITKIEGNVLIDETAYGGTPRPASWHPSDFKEAYGTGIHTFNFENNANGRKSVENPSRVFMSRLKRALSAEMITIDGKDLGEGKRTLLLITSLLRWMRL